MQKADVLLIHMPFGPITTPSIGLSLLKAAVERTGLTAEILYLNVRFAEILGVEKYRAVTDDAVTTDLVGEWIFSQALFGPKSDSEVTAYIDGVLRRRDSDRRREDCVFQLTPETAIEVVDEAISRVEPFLTECVEQIVSKEARIIGFSSVFQQQVAALSLAKRLKDSLPEVRIVFGGGNCEGVMGRELLKQFEFVDVVVSGEADIVFPEIVQTLLKGDALQPMDGVASRYSRQLPSLNQCVSNTPLVLNLDSLPWPHYDDYFDQLKAYNLTHAIEPMIPFETARGCWWGEKHHCTFCGLNGGGMKFRSKSPMRALQELTYLTEKYSDVPVNVVDNILDMSYFRTFLPLLVERQLGVNLGYEVKANLTKQQLKLLKQAGVNEIQPGIESFSDTVLELMRKGVRGLQNIQLLKWCAELEIKPVWNLIFGFPGEPEEDYQTMSEVVPLLTHLPPPYSVGRIRTDRFSPNFDRAVELGFKDLRPYPSYAHIYDLPSAARNNLAVFFTYEYQVPRDVEKYASPLVAEMMKWLNGHHASRLVSVSKGSQVFVFDSRPVAVEPITILSGVHKDCYHACDEARSLHRIHDEVSLKGSKKYDRRRIEDALGWLCERKLALRQGDTYLSLPVHSSLS